MADIVNLKRARKDKALRERQNEAETNRRRFGRTKAQKATDKDAKARGRAGPRRQAAGSREALATIFPTNLFTAFEWLADCASSRGKTSGRTNSLRR